jgi:hypothetical protein
MLHSLARLATATAFLALGLSARTALAQTACDAEQAHHDGILTATIDDKGQATFTNTSETCSFAVGTATYTFAAGVSPAPQTSYAATDSSIGPASAAGPAVLTLTVAYPSCGSFQQDAYSGQHIQASNGFPDYLGRFLAGHEFIQAPCPIGGGGTPGATPELDSLLLFGAGLMGTSGYLLARRRSNAPPAQR